VSLVVTPERAPTAGRRRSGPVSCYRAGSPCGWRTSAGVRPAPAADHPARAGRHRGGPAPGDRRLHCAHQGARRLRRGRRPGRAHRVPGDRGDPAGPEGGPAAARGDVEDVEDLALLEPATCCSPGCCSTAPTSRSPRCSWSWRRPRCAATRARYPWSPGTRGYCPRSCSAWTRSGSPSWPPRCSGPGRRRRSRWSTCTPAWPRARAHGRCCASC